MHFVGHRHARRLPLVKLGPQLVHRSAGELQRQVIRLPAFHERARSEGHDAVPVNVPRDRDAARIVHVALQHKLVVLALDLGKPRGAVHAHHVRELQHFFRDAMRRRNDKSQLPHRSGIL